MVEKYIYFWGNNYFDYGDTDCNIISQVNRKMIINQWKKTSISHTVTDNLLIIVIIIINDKNWKMHRKPCRKIRNWKIVQKILKAPEKLTIIK